MSVERAFACLSPEGVSQLSVTARMPKDFRKLAYFEKEEFIFQQSRSAN